MPGGKGFVPQDVRENLTRKPWLLVSKKGLNHLNRHLNRFGDLEGIRHKHCVHSRTSHQFFTAMAGAAALTVSSNQLWCCCHNDGCG